MAGYRIPGVTGLQALSGVLDYAHPRNAFLPGPLKAAQNHLLQPHAATSIILRRACTHSDDAVKDMAGYMAEEMNRNALSLITRKIADANRYDPAEEARRWHAQPWYGKTGGMPDFYSAAAGAKAAAYVLWAERVGPFRPWDHKPILQQRLSAAGAFNNGWKKYGGYDYYYDIWSNMHYGYVGRAAGFSITELINGAGLAQMASDMKKNLVKFGNLSFQQHRENGTWPASADDVPDHISIKLGGDLYDRHQAGSMTAGILLSAISSIPAPWGTKKNNAKELHVCN